MTTPTYNQPVRPTPGIQPAPTETLRDLPPAIGAVIPAVMLGAGIAVGACLFVLGRILYAIFSGDVR